ncbi:hypothetical protein SELMODRAFT_439431 [Selaginella moellendorffii]|uniref:Uncharacterized protein n=1 Tax=Selaginella moellendorffii TaxID=88036 RepID=D8R4D6_SELML|nr:hypothetical protein SELMODRAFT_439431 [Selaginella moellendorffii]
MSVAIGVPLLRAGRTSDASTSGRPIGAPGRWRYKISLENVVKKTSDLERIVPPYLIYVDHEHRDIVLTIRGLNLRREHDYLVLWDNKLGRQASRQLAQARVDGDGARSLLHGAFQDQRIALQPELTARLCALARMHVSNARASKISILASGWSSMPSGKSVSATSSSAFSEAAGSGKR